MRLLLLVGLTFLSLNKRFSFVFCGNDVSYWLFVFVFSVVGKRVRSDFEGMFPQSEQDLSGNDSKPYQITNNKFDAGYVYLLPLWKKYGCGE